MIHYSDDELYLSEYARLSFIMNRDGVPAALEFAKRGLKGYRHVVKDTPGIMTRRALIISCLIYRKFLREYGNGYARNN